MSTLIPSGEIRYKRSRFTARLPLDRRYTASHFWARDAGNGLWQIGFTRFAKRMLGDIVEFDFEAHKGEEVQIGQIIGWLEAFKAVSDIFCVAQGTFQGPNPKLEREPGLLESDPHGDGWLYAVQGQLDETCVDAHGYTAVLDAQIDKMLGDPHAH